MCFSKIWFYSVHFLADCSSSHLLWWFHFLYNLLCLPSTSWFRSKLAIPYYNFSQFMWFLVAYKLRILLSPCPCSQSIKHMPFKHVIRVVGSKFALPIEWINSHLAWTVLALPCVANMSSRTLFHKCELPCNLVTRRVSVVPWAHHNIIHWFSSKT